MSGTFNNAQYSFGSYPNKFNQKPKFNNKDMLFNTKKISSDVMSMSSSSSRSSVSSRSSQSGTSESSNEDKNRRSKEDYKDDEEYDDEEGSDISDDESVNSDRESVSGNHSSYQTVHKDKHSSMMNELNEKRDILYQMDRLESKGYRLPFKFNMESDIQEMKLEYNKIIREKDIDASIRFQRKMMMAFVTGTEYLNSRYDPLSVRLEGWSEQVHDTITDYDDIFEELHSKYKSSGKKMSPELRLFISLSGSAFMFHLTNRMFKESPLPNVENVLKSNPELMKQFQQAAAKQYIIGDTNSQEKAGNGGTSGLFGMVNSLFNNLGGGSRQQMFQDDDVADIPINKIKKFNKPQNDIDSIINNVHNKISFEHDQNNIETLSVSDEEITSIIEDTADIKILKNGKRKNNRTLNL